MSEALDKINELVVKYLNLKDEIIANQLILAEYENEIMHCMKAVPSKLYTNKINKFVVKIDTQTITKFNTKKFKAENPEMYESFRVASRRFNAKKLRNEKSEIYEQYTDEEISETLTIEKLEQIFEGLPTL